MIIHTSRFGQLEVDENRLITFEEGITYLLLNGQKVPLSEITEIHEGESSDDE